MHTNTHTYVNTYIYTSSYRYVPRSSQIHSYPQLYTCIHTAIDTYQDSFIEPREQLGVSGAFWDSFARENDDTVHIDEAGSRNLSRELDRVSIYMDTNMHACTYMHPYIAELSNIEIMWPMVAADRCSQWLQPMVAANGCSQWLQPMTLLTSQHPQTFLVCSNSELRTARSGLTTTVQSFPNISSCFF